MVKIVDDPFTEGSNTELDAHTPNTAGDGWTEEENTTTPDRPMFVIGGAGHASVVTGDSNARVVYSAQPNPTVTEYDVGLVFETIPPAPVGTKQGVFARWTDVDNHYFGSVSQNTGAGLSHIQILKEVATVITEIAVAFPTEVVTGDEKIFKVRDSTDRQVWRNETQATEITADDTALTSAGKCGLWQGNFAAGSANTTPGWDLDEFYWDDLAAAVAGIIPAASVENTNIIKTPDRMIPY